MSDFSRLAQDAAETTWPSEPPLGLASVSIRYLANRRPVAWVYRGADKNEILAIAGGEDSGVAWRNLLRVIYRDDRNLTTQEVAEVLGVADATVRQLMQDGKLEAVQRGDRNHASRFSPQNVYALTLSARRQG